MTAAALTGRLAPRGVVAQLVAGIGSRARARKLQVLLGRDGSTCWRCGCAVDVNAPRMGAWAPSLDHRVPRSEGGSDRLSNPRIAHRRCTSNRDRDKLPLPLPGAWGAIAP